MAGTVTYNWPGTAGTTVPQTAPNPASIVKAQVVFADADTIATILHNWNLSTAELAAQFPLCIVNASTSGTAPLTFAVSWASSVALVLTKANVAGSGGTFDVAVLRPWSAMK